MSSVYCSTCDGTQEGWVDINNLPFFYPGIYQDTSFVIGDGFTDTVRTIELQSDGKILVGGDFRDYSGVTRNRIIRLNTDGSIDESFIIGDGFDGSVRSIQLQPNGKILVGGGFAEYSGVSSNGIIRLNTDGSIDESFTFDSGFDSAVYSLSIQPDGKIVVGGDFTSYSGVSSSRIIRLNTNGSVDTSFIIGDGFNSSVITLQLQPDGKIIVGGDFTEYSGVSSSRIIRLNTNGSVDTSFIIGDGFDGTVFITQLQPDGKILVGGLFSSYSGVSYNNIIRLNTDGSIDESFVIGDGFDREVFTMQLQSDGKIMAGGSFNQFNGTNSNYIVRLVENAVNSSYRTTNQLCVYAISGLTYNGNLVFDAFNNQILYNQLQTIETQPDGKVLLGGSFTNFIIRLFPDGSIDPTFNVGSGFNGTVYKIKILNNGKILVGGGFTTYNGYSSNYIARLNSDGSFDETFDIGTGFNNLLRDIEVLSDGRILCGGSFTTFNLLFNIGSGFNNSVQTIKLQSDGKILVGGEFTSYSGVSANRVIRLNTDGSVDNSFVIGTGFNNQVGTIELQSDGKIIVGGVFTSYSGVSRNRIIRLNTNGSIDNSFVIGTGFNTGQVQNIQLQTDGKILVGGFFSSYSGVSRNNIIRLNTDGSVDNSFVIGGGTNANVYSIKIQSDGKILVGGTFNSYSGVTRNRIIRLNTDGSIDTSFSIGTGFNSGVSSIQLQSDGKILVGGNFGTYSGVTRNRIIRLNTDGSIDTSFVIGTGFNSTVNTIELQSDGKIIVGGVFTSYSGVTRNRIISLNTDGSVDTSFVIGTGFGNNVRTLELQPDGKILVGGDFSDYNTFPCLGLIRLTSNGSIDGNQCNRIAVLNDNGNFNNSFVIGDGFNDVVRSIELQPDGKILVGGDFTEYSGVTRNRIIRLNTDGSIDNSFVIGTGFNSNIQTIQLQSDGKILVGGNFGTYSGVTSVGIIRLNTDGSIDNSFVIGTGFNNPVYAIQLQSDGKILVGGDFTDYSGVSSDRIIRLNTDGSVDNSFVIGTGFDSTVRSIQLQPDGKILVGGDFTSFDIIPRYYIAELYSEGSTPFELTSFLEFSSCTECFNFTINSGDEYLMCEVCSGDTFTVNPPHPVWTNNYGTAVTMLDAIVLGGPNGLNN